MKTIPIQNSINFIIVLDEHYERLIKFKWYENSNKSRIYRTVQSKTRFKLSGYPATEAISIANEVMQTQGIKYDHKDINYLNNVPDNLRICNNSTNGANKRKKRESGLTSQYKGVSWMRIYKKWNALIYVDGVRINLGYFDNEVEAAVAYDDAAILHFKEFAKLNFPLVVY